MEKFKHLQKIKDIYAKGENIIQYLKKSSSTEQNSIEDILISYDFQSGSYIKNLLKDDEWKRNYCTSFAKVIENLGKFESLIEVGVGEATTLKYLLERLNNIPNEVLGLDISWSRLKFAKEYISGINTNNLKLFTANLFEIPLLDNSIDIVYTSHSIEPNGGKEEEALKELYRITKKYLILLEPCYELASSEAKLRMKSHRFVTNLYETAKQLNYNIIEYRLFDFSANPLNPTGLMIIEKNSEESNSLDLVCPISHTNLQQIDDNFLYSKDSFLAYPILKDIPCLLKENSILAAHLLTDYNSFIKSN